MAKAVHFLCHCDHEEDALHPPDWWFLPGQLDFGGHLVYKLQKPEIKLLSFFIK